MSDLSMMALADLALSLANLAQLGTLGRAAPTSSHSARCEIRPDRCMLIVQAATDVGDGRGCDSFGRGCGLPRDGDLCDSEVRGAFGRIIDHNLKPREEPRKGENMALAQILDCNINELASQAQKHYICAFLEDILVTIVLSSINLKGGVGKTTIAVNYAAYCSNKGRRVLLCDLDPQANASFGMIGVEGWEQHTASKGTVADLLGARRHKSAQGEARGFDDVVISNAWTNVDLIPSHLDLFTVDLDLAGITAREFQLKKSLKDSLGNYDIVICDCPPNLTLPTQNALAISTNFVVPVSLDYLSVLGIGLLLSRVRSLSEDLDVSLTNSGIIISRVGRPAKHRAETESVVRGKFGGDVLSGKITDRVAIGAAMEKAQSIYSGYDHAAIAEFNYIFSELDQKLGLQ
ncbi:MAG: hypothetical protein EA385_06455 [Salinarimonadaceae bacterium]|nr:MAG: hypothetical protein EA385_06455 [Salinarimonadaceae bacterium]